MQMQDYLAYALFLLTLHKILNQHSQDAESFLLNAWTQDITH